MKNYKLRFQRSYPLKRKMKTKKNKKYYNFTEYQKRRDGSLKHEDNNADSGFRKVFNEERKARNRHTLNRILQGDEMEFPVERKDVNWWYF